MDKYNHTDTNVHPRKSLVTFVLNAVVPALMQHTYYTVFKTSSKRATLSTCFSNLSKHRFSNGAVEILLMPLKLMEF